MPNTLFCVHGHFYQPPRDNPFVDDQYDVEADAAPYRNHNEKATALCYKPNAELGNFERLSFDLGNTVSRWLEPHEPEVYKSILAADKAHLQKWGAGNALAIPTHHTILPLLRKRDKMLQVRWGQISFEHRFGHAPEGMWLPEMAVDLETLQVFADCGLKFTILSQSQVEGATEGAGPYWVNLPAGNRIAVYVRDDQLSNLLAFNVNALGGAGRWARGELAPLASRYGRMLLLALEGETFGYHYPREEHFLRWLLEFEITAVGFNATTLGRDFAENQPTKAITIKENTAWSDSRGLARWATGYVSSNGDSTWKSALRRAFDNLASHLDEHYLLHFSKLIDDPWLPRENWLRIRLGQITESQLLRDSGLQNVSADKAEALLSLLRAQFYRQRMYVSRTFAYDDLDRDELRYAIANAVRATRLTEKASGENPDLLGEFRNNLELVISSKTTKTGAHILDDVLVWERETVGTAV